MFAYGDVFDPTKMYCGKNWVEKFVKNIADEVKQKYAIFTKQPVEEIIDVLKK